MLTMRPFLLWHVRLYLPANLLFAGLLAIPLTLLLLWSLDRLHADRDSTSLEFVATHGLTITEGAGRQTDAGFVISQSGPRRFAVVQAALRPIVAHDYAAIAWRVDGLADDQQLRLIWATSDHVSAPRSLPLPHRQSGRITLQPSAVPDWRGTIVAVGLVITGSIHTPLTIRSLQLTPAASTFFDWLAGLPRGWSLQGNWAGASINFLATDDPTSSSPALAMACWAALASILFLALSTVMRAGFCRRNIGLALLAIWITSWAVLDLRWQSDLLLRLYQDWGYLGGFNARQRTERGGDPALSAFIGELKIHLPDTSARIVLVAETDQDYAARRGKYLLLPHNAAVFAFDRLPEHLRVGEYLFVFADVPDARFNRSDRRLRIHQRVIFADLLFNRSGVGALFRIREAD